MNVQTAATAETPLAERLAPLLPGIAAAAVETERLGRVPATHVATLREIGYFDAVKPERFGGAPRPFADLVAANIRLSAACANTGWVAGLLAAHQWLLAMFPLRAQQDVWEADPDALLCGSYAPVHPAEPAGDGYRLSGAWAFASGCDNASWALCASILPGARPVPAFLLVPSTDYRIEDSWDVTGLAGTGSKSLILEGVFVPPHRVLTFPDATSGRTPGATIYSDQALFNIPLLSGIPACLASAAVGAAEGALTAFVEGVRSRETRGAVAGTGNRMAEFPTIQLRVAEALASVDAAREILLRDIAEAERVAGQGAEFPRDLRLKCRRGQAFAVRLAVAAAEALNGATGGAGLQRDNPVQRAWRDANAVGRHISMNWDAVGTMTGQHAFGLEPRGQY